MLNTNNNMAILKKNILAEIVKLQLEGKLSDSKTVSQIELIPEKVVPDGTIPVTGSLENDRSIVRARIVADLGFSLEDYNPQKPLADYVNQAFGRQKPTGPVLTM